MQLKKVYCNDHNIIIISILVSIGCLYTIVLSSSRESEAFDQILKHVSIAQNHFRSRKKKIPRDTLYLKEEWSKSAQSNMLDMLILEDVDDNLGYASQKEFAYETYLEE